MSISAACVKCGTTVIVRDDLAGRTVRCKCGAVVLVPNDAPAPVAQLAAVNMTFAWVPAGSFLMGSAAAAAEKPVHRVTISRGFFMGIHPVTQAQWEPIMRGFNPSHFRSPDRPVEMVSWSDGQDYCQKLRKLTGKPIRLATEAEWEYACRAGSTTECYNGNDEYALKKAGWFKTNSNNQTQPVGRLAANAWGLFDMHGNVWEWTQDCYGPYVAQDETDPSGAAAAEFRVLRGGAWSNGYAGCRSASRAAHAPGERANWAGLRVCFNSD